MGQCPSATNNEERLARAEPVVINQTIRCTSNTTLLHVVGRRTDTLRHNRHFAGHRGERNSIKPRSATQPKGPVQLDNSIFRVITTERCKDIPFVGTQKEHETARRRLLSLHDTLISVGHRVGVEDNLKAAAQGGAHLYLLPDPPTMQVQQEHQQW